MAFGSKLKELREAAKLTQSQLATAAGMSKGGVANLEQGIRVPGWATIQKLAGALGVGVEAFAKPASDASPTGRGRPRKAAVAKPATKKRVGRPKK